MKNSALYEEIESQLNRLRVIRILFWVEVILTISGVVYAITHFSGDWSVVVIPLVPLATAGFTIWAIIDRYNRYCRAVERSYTVLCLDQLGQSDSAISAQW
jgi:hypothetical protein